MWGRFSEEVRNRLAERVLKKRRELGWTQAVLSQRTGIAVTHICHIEHGAANPSLELLVILASTLGTTVGALVDE
ncbi:helix-turn-helix domain-containing protein [Novosphingobium acidiphilum]|uniref:helix-turn-helix domain-containing protein n=1 Tax=Novosphingobium acidiphilum TaxID=505248 RepID=UPI003CCBA584